MEFSGQVNNVIELEELGRTRDTLDSAIAALNANGDTALLDGVRTAYQRLQERGDKERINAIVAMTDGRENASSVSLNTLVREIQRQSNRRTGGDFLHRLWQRRRLRYAARRGRRVWRPGARRHRADDS
ncbi:MAG: VWA domain-containing protein [Anaerolineae bacterium]|nr:VWA domain-containing protein [Anaerolineae bacterium]